MDSTQQFIADQLVTTGTDRDALEDLAKQKRLKCLIYHRKRYDISREQKLAKRKAAYQPTRRKVGRPRLPRE